MKLFIDINTREILAEQYSERRIARVDFTRGDTSQIDLVFLNSDSEIVTLDPTFTIKLGIKSKLDYSGDFLVYTDSFTESDSVYTANPDFNTEDLAT